MQLKIAFLLMFPCLVGAQVYNPSNNLPSSASFPGHNAMGASGAANTGQWQTWGTPSGPTSNILNAQETSTTAAGENGIVSLLTWNPTATVSYSPLYAAVLETFGNMDGQADTNGTFNGAFIGAMSNGNTTAVQSMQGVNVSTVTKGTAHVADSEGVNVAQFLLSTAPVDTLIGFDSYIETDSTPVIGTMAGFTESIGIQAGTTITNAYGIWLQAADFSGSTVTHAYAIKSDDTHPSAFAGLIATSKGGAVTSATSITPTGQIFHVTGTTAVATIVAPAGCTDANQGCQLTLIPDAAFTTTAAGNIALASTAVLNKALIMTYDSGTSKWYPSY